MTGVFCGGGTGVEQICELEKEPMITTLTMNPCIDKTFMIRGFEYGEVNRVVESRTDPCGKGINVSVALHNLGVETRAVSIIYREHTELYRRMMEERGIPFEAAEAPGRVRECIKVWNLEDGVNTEVNERGGAVPEENVRELLHILETALRDSDAIVVTGSVPQGIAPDFYKTVLQMAKSCGAFTVLDAEGELFLRGLEAKPDLIKPNLYEITRTFGLPSDDLDVVLKKCCELIAEGSAGEVCLSMGSRGALMTDGREAYLVKSTPGREVKGTQGAGDSVVAGICRAKRDGLSLREQLISGVAAAQASVILPGTELCRPEDYEKMRGILTAEKLL